MISKRYVIAVIVLSGLLIYSNTFHVPFVFDDFPNIVKKPEIQIDRLSIDSIHQIFSLERPLSFLSFAINYLYGKLDVFGYHLVNIIIHISTGIGLYFLTWRTLLFSNGGDRRSAHLLAALSALIWMVHPLQTQSVTYIVQRMTSMAGMFYVFSLSAFLKGRSASVKSGMKWYILCCIMAGLALLSKQNSITLIPIIFLAELCIVRKGQTDFLFKKSVYIPILIFAILASIATMNLMQYGSHPFQAYFSSLSSGADVVKERIFSESRVFFIYLSLWFIPISAKLNLLHDIDLSRGLFMPVETFVALCGILIYVGYAFYLIKKKPLIAFLLLWFIINIAPESLYVGIKLIFEHRMYVPSMSLAILTALALNGLYSRIDERTFIVVCSMLVLLLCINTYMRNNVWRDSITLWSDTAGKSPYSGFARGNLGISLYKAGRIKESVSDLAHAQKMDPMNPLLIYYLGIAQYKAELYEDALVAFRKLWKMGLDSPPGNSTLDRYVYNLGIKYRNRGKILLAKQVIDEAAFYYPQNIRILDLKKELENKLMTGR